MAFVNEYISEENIKKYNIREILKKFHPLFDDNDLDAVFGKYSWTIDKDEYIFLILVTQGREDESNQESCAFWWKGTLLGIKIANEGGGLDYTNKTGSVTWGLVDIWRPDDFSVPEIEIINSLKDALIVYQLRGVRIPMDHYSVNFNF